MSILEDWTAAVCAELGIADIVDGRSAVPTVLDLARDVAHGVARPAAPLTAYLVGLAVARSPDPEAALPDVVRRVTAMIDKTDEAAP
jgi:Domain of unknown function (DUF6457)